MKKFFTDKKIRYGTFSTVITLVFIVVLIVVNLIIGELDHKFDMTSADTYSISDKTKTVLDGLDKDITIYTLFKTGNSDNIVTRVQRVLDQYAENPHIKVENKDLYLYPEFMKDYYSEDKPLAVNSIVVTNANNEKERFKIINYEDYFDTSGTFNVESCVTSAINYVGLESDSVVYAVTGHGEIEPDKFTNFVKQANLANYEFKTVNLLENDIPDDCTVLLMTTCYRDYSEDEVQKIKDYLTADGRLMCVASDINKEDHPNMVSILNAYGVDIGKIYIMESDPKNYMQLPFEVMAQQTDHSINNSLKEGNYKVLAYGTNDISVMDLKKQGLEIEDVLTSSATSYIKTDGNKSYNYEEGDKTGPFTIAAAITDKTYTDTSHSTKLMVIGSFYMLDAKVDSAVNGANSTFLVNSLNWLNDSEDSIYIRPKTLAGESIVIDAGTVNKIKIFAWGVIPGIIFAVGIIVCLRRRNG